MSAGMTREILIIGDSKQFRDDLHRAAGKEYRIRRAADEIIAYTMIATKPPHIILYSPPLGRSKLAFLASLKALPCSAEIPVIVLANQAAITNKNKAFQAGAVGYLVKPIVMVEVITHIRALLALKKADHKIKTQHFELKKRVLELTQARYVFLKGMAGLAEMRDPETGDHLLRVYRYMRVLTKCLCHYTSAAYEIKRESIPDVSRAAILHDIGKVGISDSILLKPDKLTSDEFEHIKKHTSYGEHIIRRLLHKRNPDPFLLHACDIAGGHHENWNGTGYPNKLKETDIPLSARLMAVADVYDSIISPRVYKKARPHLEAVEFIMDNKGIKFDPHIADLFYKHNGKFQSIAQRFAPLEVEYSPSPMEE